MTLEGTRRFVRVEDGPEGDRYMEVESVILDRVRDAGVPTPRVYAVNATRDEVPFAFQVLELISCPDLNRLHKDGNLDLPATAARIGEAVARWQVVEVGRFGPFDPDILRAQGALAGFHENYADYFNLHLERHLEFLTARNFLPPSGRTVILRALAAHRPLLELTGGCLVHKDLALWNILGTANAIGAFIDWDDAISGDPMDDISLLGCFYNGDVVGSALEGYQSVKGLPANHRERFWLHLLRNMLVKAVIRVGAGYFDRGEELFLFDRGMSGSEFQTFTLKRIYRALEGLKSNSPIQDL